MFILLLLLFFFGVDSNFSLWAVFLWLLFICLFAFQNHKLWVRIKKEATKKTKKLNTNMNGEERMKASYRRWFGQFARSYNSAITIRKLQQRKAHKPYTNHRKSLLQFVYFFFPFVHFNSFLAFFHWFIYMKKFISAIVDSAKKKKRQ